MPEPFERCAPYAGESAFSRQRTEAQRATTPDVCCYTGVRYMAVKGRPLWVSGRSTEATLVRSSRELGWHL